MNDRKPERRGLGRGLSALMADVSHTQDAAAEQRSSDQLVPVENIHANAEQPRRDFDPEKLQELSASIKEKGVLQPIVVRPSPSQDGLFEIVAGERRWRAAQMAQVHAVPVIVRDLSDTEVLEFAIIENIQRADLNPLEEAAGYKQLIERFGHTQEKISEAMGKSRSHIANLLRLLTLPPEVTMLLRQGQLSAGHARALITAENPAQLAQTVVARGLNVRETETLARGPIDKSVRKPRDRKSDKDADTVVLEQDLSANLGMAVEIDHRAGGEGQIIIRYQRLDQLDQLCQLLSTSS
ncbi:ParB/RepB/Spo0J family partition protein [Roseicitreum antarcticum]|uniref:Chromosome partitioning protein, ParB family n=1 Tax=Roseicitreum antarcticum TaxID=564137 RepID=A0A1H2QZN9_9RHOB|nr:ParB/RepB/Spo0J family partition protein [Roseicitreum antarcticum]SDW12094.1 chromosome partitioning protein, ParB family [Roseicitreum antarcticum]